MVSRARRPVRSFPHTTLEGGRGVEQPDLALFLRFSAPSPRSPSQDGFLLPSRRSADAARKQLRPIVGLAIALARAVAIGSIATLAACTRVSSDKKSTDT